MGYAGNLEPIIVPTIIVDLENKNTSSASTKSYEYNYYIGDEAINKKKESNTHKLIYPVKNGIVENWDLMEKYWYKSIYDYLKCDPEEHIFVLTEPTMNPPENRENIAEIFFETFNVPGLYFGDQAFLSLLGYRKYTENNVFRFDKEQQEAFKSLTGLVVDSGDDITHIIPICDGTVVGSNIKHFPIAGKHITKFMEQMIKERGEKINSVDLYYATMEIKEKYGYLARDLIDELNRFDRKQNINGKLTQSIKFKKFKGTGKISSKPFSIDLGYEILLGPEAFFYPEIIDKNWKAPLDEMIDLAIQQCPIEYKRRLYANILLSGGSSSFLNLDKKIEFCLKNRVDKRLKKYNYDERKDTNNIKVNIRNFSINKFAAWLGGSYFSSKSDFKSVVYTREQYLEKGPSFCRFNPLFRLNLEY